MKETLTGKKFSCDFLMCYIHPFSVVDLKQYVFTYFVHGIHLVSCGSAVGIATGHGLDD